jgi:hypothetical protein
MRRFCSLAVDLGAGAAAMRVKAVGVLMPPVLPSFSVLAT